ncbi:hypothetical protein [Ferroplasma acidarmanus]|uniref:Uncharacterized protein n=1 Tax=Ferroplasma acidarmanus Fer1 TaxID=333146 RepID=S0APZ2_FERAC|nr:hypothetical protein [Ferroplasma acidarmanus]AGO61323.1 hypothetical protein FACI_IFERC00001G1343 [Ferroplasma acidarmanus Fer1]
MGINIIGLFLDYRTSFKFFYPVVVLLFLTLVVTFHSRKYKNKEMDEIIRDANLKIEDTHFLKELKLIKSGDFSSYLMEIDNDMSQVTLLLKHYKLMVRKYHKYNAKSKNSSRIMRKHAAKMKDAYLQYILDDYESIKKIKMNMINTEVYDEWKKQKI